MAFYTGYQPLQNLEVGTVFSLSASGGGWFSVRRQVEDYTEVVRPNGKLSIIVATALVWPVHGAKAPKEKP